MTLPASHPITAQQINIELGRSPTAVFNMNGAAERALAGVPSGGYSFSNFLGKTAGGGGGGDPTVSFLGTGAGPHNFGAEEANRVIAATISWTYTDSVHHSITSVTIGGIAASVSQIGHSGGSTGFGTAVASANVPTGASGSIVTIFDGGGIGEIGVFRVGNLASATPVASTTAQQAGTATTIEDTVTTTTGGVLVASYGSSTGAAGAAVTWTGATEAYDLEGTGRQSAASRSGTPAGTTFVEAALSGGISNSGNALVLRSFA